MGVKNWILIMSAFTFVFYNNCGGGFNSNTQSPDIAFQDNSSFDPDGKPQSDIVFIVDKSSRMPEAPAEIGRQFDALMSQLDDSISWRVGIITANGSGELLRFDKYMLRVKRRIDKDNFEWTEQCELQTNSTDETYFIDQSTPKEEAQKLFLDTIRCAEDSLQSQRITNDKERKRGIYSLQRAIERTTESEVNQKFFRRHSNLVAIVLSNANDFSGVTERGAPTDQGTAPADQLIETIQRWNQLKTLHFHSVIAEFGQNGAGCIDRPGFFEGANYNALSLRTNGMVRSICSEDFSEFLGGVGQQARNVRPR